mgnify:FL=1
MSPFAGYESFDTCVAQNDDKRDAKAYCAAVQARSEGKSDLTERDEAIAAHFAEGDKPGFSYRLGVEVFRAGTHTNSRGEERIWSQKDLDHMVTNFDKKVPPFSSVKSGHSSDEYNEKLAEALGIPKLMVDGDGDDRDGQLSLGRVTNLYRHEDSLLATMEVPTVISNLIDAGGINSVSAEILHNYKGNGFALGGVALLGAERPALNGLESFSDSNGTGDRWTSELVENGDFKEFSGVVADKQGLDSRQVEKAQGVAEDAWNIMTGVAKDEALRTRHQSGWSTVVRVLNDRFAKAFKEGKIEESTYDEDDSDGTIRTGLSPEEEQWLFPVFDNSTGRSTTIQIGAPDESIAKATAGTFLENLAGQSGSNIGKTIVPVVSGAAIGAGLLRFTLGKGTKLGALLGGVAGFEENEEEADYYISSSNVTQEDFDELCDMYDEDSPMPMSQAVMRRSSHANFSESHHSELILTVDRNEDHGNWYWDMREEGSGAPAAEEDMFNTPAAALADAKAYAEDEGWEIQTTAGGNMIVLTEREEDGEAYAESDFASPTARAVHSLGILKRAGKKIKKKVVHGKDELKRGFHDGMAHQRLKETVRRHGMDPKNVKRPARKGRKVGRYNEEMTYSEQVLEIASEQDDFAYGSVIKKLAGRGKRKADEGLRRAKLKNQPGRGPLKNEPIRTTTTRGKQQADARNAAMRARVSRRRKQVGAGAAAGAAGVGAAEAARRRRRRENQ